MSEATLLVSQLLDHASGKERPAEGSARSTYLTLGATVLSLGAASLWGVALGCTAPALALANAYKVPMVLALSLLGSLPPALLWLKLSGANLSPLAIVGSAAQGVFAGTMWLLALTPLMGLYFYTSSWAGPILALASSLLSLASGFHVLLRRIAQKAENERDRALGFRCGVLLCLLQLLVLWQLLVLVSPILPEGSPFSHGIDALWGRG